MVNAPQFPDGLTWFNSKPLTLFELGGKVVLVDFWTYSCINCQRTLPILRKWRDKYRNQGLVIIGVHSPEFEFEKNPKNIHEALEKYEVTWPVVVDNDMEIWQSYSNHYWPAKYLIDHEGKIIYSHFGEGNYLETELKIQEALKDAGFKVNEQVVGGSEQRLEGSQTPELYFGTLRGILQNIPQDISIKPDQIYTIGQWREKQEYLQHGRETKELDDLIILSYRAKDVYLVMEAQDGKEVKVYVTLDGIGLTEESAGKDIRFDSDMRSFIEIQFATLYHLISAQTFGDHILRLSTLSDKLRLFAFTFGS